MERESAWMTALDAVGNLRLHAVEEEEAGDEDDGDGGSRSGEREPGRLAVSGDGPAEAVDDAGHGIESIKPAPANGNESGWIGDGGGEHPELDEEGNDVFDVAIESVERGKPEANAKGGGNGEKKKKGKPEHGDGGTKAVDGRDDSENDAADGEIDEAGKDGRDGKNQAGEIDFGDDALIFDDDVGGSLEGSGEVSPRDEGSEIENGIGEAERGEFGEAPEEQSENEHGEERLEDNPGDANGRLLVADLDVAPNEEEEEFAILPKFSEAQLEPGARGLDANDSGSMRRKNADGRRRCGNRSHG